MRVNIQYSVDTEELPDLTAKLIEKSIEAIDMDLIEKLATPYEILSVETAETIDKLRQSLATTDALLQDAHNIIMGWVHYKSTPVVPPPSNGVSQAIGPDELQEKLTAFKNSLAAQQQNETPD